MVGSKNKRLRVANGNTPWSIAGSLAKQVVKSFEVQVGDCLTKLSREQPYEIAGRYTERFVDDGYWFTPAERACVNVLASLIVPSDETGAGANGVEVPDLSVVETIERLVANSKHRRVLYASGFLRCRLARRKYDRPFIELMQEQQLNLLKRTDRLQQGLSSRTSLIREIKKDSDNSLRNWPRSANSNWSMREG